MKRIMRMAPRADACKPFLIESWPSDGPMVIFWTTFTGAGRAPA